MSRANQFKSFFGTETQPVLLAPLAGVSDHPFRRICVEQGADLSYVEMLSAQAIKYKNERTFEMMKRHPSEKKLGVQVTGADEDVLASAVELLGARGDFDTVDINMGCPVTKVVKTGCGSALLRDTKKLARMTKLCRNATDLPLSAKIRLGWDRPSVNVDEVVGVIADAGLTG